MDKKARHCPYCDKVYVSMPAFSMHVRTHNQGCECQYCGKCFSRPWLLQGHIRTHTGEKPFKCSVCSKAFADKSNLRAHIQTHSNTKPHTCARCGKAFALKSYLYKHEESSCMKNRSEAAAAAAAAGAGTAPTTTSSSRQAAKQATELEAQPAVAAAASSPDSAKSTLAHKLLQKEKDRRQAQAQAQAQATLAFGYAPAAPLADAFGRELFHYGKHSACVLQPTVLQHASQEHLHLPLYQHYPHAAATVTPNQHHPAMSEVAEQEQPVDFSPKNNFTHSAKTSPFEVTGKYAMVA